MFLLSTAVAGLCMQQASQLLGLVQSEGQSAYTMSDLTRPPLPFEDDRVVAAYRAWRAAAVNDAEDSPEVDEHLLGLVRSSITWHVALDILFFAPSVALVIAWFLRRSFPKASFQWRIALPALYLLADLLETWWTWKLADAYLVANNPVLSGTFLLVVFTSVKWFFVLVAAVVVVLAALTHEIRCQCEIRCQSEIRFQSVKLMARLLWTVRVQVIAVLVLAVLLAFPLAGPLDQVPDLLRSAHDESWRSSAVWNPLALLVALSALIWSSGMLIVREVPTEESASAVDDPPVLNCAAYFRSRLPWVLLTVVLNLVATIVCLKLDNLRPSYAVFAAGVVSGALLALDLLVAVLRRWKGIKALPPKLRVGDAKPLEWLVLALAATPLAVGGFGLVRAYGPLVLLQFGDPTRTAYEGATAWFWFGAASAVVAPLVGVWFLRRLVPRCSEDGDQGPLVRQGGWHFRLVLGVSIGVAVVMTVLAGYASRYPAEAGAALEVNGLITVLLGVVLAFLGMLQWLSEKQKPVALARVLGMARTPWIVVVVTVFMVAGIMDTSVGYHAVTLTKGEAPRQEKLEKAFERWYEQAKDCRKGALDLPLVLVAAPGGGARAAYWTGQVMARLQSKDLCAGRSVFAASGVSGGSVGLAVWSATADSGIDQTQESLAALVGPEPLSATVAAMFFRDLPRAFVGLHPHGVDRAAVQQDVWIDKVPGLGDDFFTLPADETWRPLLILNASDIATGCKVLISQIEVHPKEHIAAAQQCKVHPSNKQVQPTALQAGAVDALQFLDLADCPVAKDKRTENQNESENVNLSLAAASLLSARFPYVSPSGALTACQEGGEERLYVADGGYLENSGLHTLLALWHDLEPLVAERNANDGPKVLPVAILVENRYRSEAVLRAGGRVRELTGPPNADRAALVRSEALEQALAAEFSQPVQVQGVDSSDRRWFVIAPSTHPDVSAPLGWALSKATRTELDCQIPQSIQVTGDDDAACGDADDKVGLAKLIDILTGSSGGSGG